MERQSLQVKPNFLRYILVAIGVSFSFLFMTIAMQRMEWERVGQSLSNAELYPWLIFSVLCYLTGHLVRGVRTRLLVSRDAKLSVLTASNIVVVGYAVNNILPGRLGELARAGMLSERTGISFIQSITVVLIERLLDGIVIVMLLTMSALFLNTTAPVRELLSIASLIFGLALALLIFLVIAPNRLMTSTSRIIYTLKPNWHDRVLRFVTFIINGVGYLCRPINVLSVFAVSLMVWLFDVGLFLFLLPAFGLELNIANAVFVMAVTNLGILIPSGPGHIVHFRSFCIQGLAFLGIAQTTALSFAMVVHLAFYIPITLWGGAVILWYGIVLGLTINLTKKAKAIAGLPEVVSSPVNILGTTLSGEENESPSAFVLKLTEASLPLDSVFPANPQAVVLDVATFVNGEIRSLPRRFRMLFNISMGVFALLVWLRYLRAFSLLPLPKRVQIFNIWAYGNIALTRKLFKLVRSTALLAFYEHPAIMEVLENQKSKVQLPETAACSHEC